MNHFIRKNYINRNINIYSLRGFNTSSSGFHFHRTLMIKKTTDSSQHFCFFLITCEGINGYGANQRKRRGEENFPQV